MACRPNNLQVVAKAVVQRCSVKMVFLEISQNSQKNTCTRASFSIKLQPEACNFIKKETLTQVFSCEICEIPKNTSLDRTPLVAASVHEKFSGSVTGSFRGSDS